MSPGGRRPGKTDTRQEIIQAARRVFADKGYEQASLRAVARAAGVDAALVHHYFDGKSALFMAAMSLPFDPRTVKEESVPSDTESSRGAATVEGFLAMWDKAEGTGSSFASTATAMATSESVAAAVREFVSERVWSVHDGRPEDDEATFWRRRAMISAQLMGLAFNRYILRMPPISTATPADIGRWVGPNIDRYANDPDL
jgi:AcrR family transcriptional regulator